MKIRKKTNKRRVLFEEIGFGEVFSGSDEFTVFIKLEDEIEVDTVLYNCVDLSYGTLSYMEPDDEVIALNAELVVEN